MQLAFCTVFPRLKKLTVKTMEIFANGELVKAFLRGLLGDEHVHGVPLDTLPSESVLTFDTRLLGIEGAAEMTAFCTAMQCDTERHFVSVLEAQRPYFNGVLFR